MIFRLKKKILLVIHIVLLTGTGFTQSSTFNGWLASFHEQELSPKWSLLSDIQVRSADQFRSVENILLRPALNYKLTDRQSVAMGYLYLGTWMEKNTRTFNLEHRIWEQYRLETKINKTNMTNRFRLEQRFLQKEQKFNFVQRFRHYIRFQIPFIKQKEFKKGVFLGLQNEVFLNIQHKEKVNNRFFDQNRAYTAIGYKFSTAVQVEAGYLYRYQITDEKKNNHILQAMINTKL